MAHHLRLWAGVAATAVALTGAVLSSAPAIAAEAPIVKTLIIGIDGAAYDFLGPAEMPRLDALRAQGTTSVSNLYASPMAGTWSGPGWASIATGVWPDKHNVLDNGFGSPQFGAYPDYLTRINAASPSRKTAAMGTWEPITATIFGPGVDVRTKFSTDAETTTAAVDAISTGSVDDLFFYLEDVDKAGHSVGTNGAAYGAALASADARIGQVMDAVAARPANEEWTVVVTTDHGHTPTGGHGGSSPVERRVFTTMVGKGVAANVTRYDAKLVDVAPTIMAAAGVPVKPEWNLDGTSLGSLTHDAFDSLRPALQPGVDETAIPTGTLGWTKTTPEGWSIDNSAMPSGGTAEWRGWTFATDDFWTAADRDQRRETTVRGRDVIAVADSDEWDDKQHASGQFDSTLVSPAFDVAGLRRASLGYATNYAIDGPQSATVTVTFDTGASQTLKSYSTATNTVEKLPFTVPAGATTAQFRFRYTGENSSFWAVDAVGIQDAIKASDIRYVVNAGGQQTSDWLSLTGAAAQDGGLLNSAADQPFGADPSSGAAWGYESSGSGSSGESSGDMFSTLRYAVSSRDQTYRFGNLQPGEYTVHAGYADPWSWDNRGAKVTINNEVRESDHDYSSENQTVAYGDVTVGGNGELTFTLSKTRSSDVQLSWLIVSSANSEEAGNPPTHLATTTMRCIGKKAYLAVSVQNTTAQALTITVDTAYGSKSFAGVAPGKSASIAFNSRTAVLPAGSVSVTSGATGETAGFTSTVPYTGISCP
ncbi:alkaline phosphatase family protein [Paenarthrobacter histidinolovorans]|uniref:Type I phosphodiesterase/nucleotide pyrophosphatase n=1 Tax=Paenarthrobacter histidinolovorans TaxID=43664 RepID=A0ABW8N9L5_9MICC